MHQHMMVYTMVVSVYSRNPHCGILNGFCIFKLLPSINDNQPEIHVTVLLKTNQICSCIGVISKDGLWPLALWPMAFGLRPRLDWILEKQKWKMLLWLASRALRASSRISHLV